MTRLLLSCALACAASRFAAAQDTTRLSVDSSGVEGDGSSFVATHCVGVGKSTFVVFSSSATNLVKGDTNGKTDLFLRDVVAGTTTRIVLDAKGGEPDGDSRLASITPDGRFVLFKSDATDLVSGDKNGVTDVFVLDRKSGLVERVSVDSKGNEGDAISNFGAISDDGQLVVFSSRADNLVGSDSNSTQDVFLRDLANQTTSCVSVTPSGGTGNGFSTGPVITADGSKIAFTSLADDLVSNDSNHVGDVFLFDVASGTTTLATLNEGGYQLNGISSAPALSADGALLAFRSAATNLDRAATSGLDEIYVRDLSSGKIWLASRANDGSAADANCSLPMLFSRADAAGDRPQVAFSSGESNLPDADLATDIDAFVFDLRSGVVQCASVDSAGGGHDSNVISSRFGATPDGKQLVFGSFDSALVSGDGNGSEDVFLRGLQWTFFSEFGSGLAGADGFVPHLSGTGGWCEAGIWQLQIHDGLGAAVGHLWVGFGRTNGVKLFGGTFYVDFAQPIFPVPIQLDGFAGVSGSGDLTIDGVNVEDLGEFSIFMQVLLLDLRAPKGISMSNALELAIDAG